MSSSVFNYEQAELSILDNAYMSLNEKHKSLINSWLTNGSVSIETVEASELTQKVDTMLQAISDLKRQLAENKDKLDLKLDSKRHHNRPHGAGIADMATLGGSLTIAMALKETVRGIFTLVSMPFRSKEGFATTAATGGAFIAYKLLDEATKKMIWEQINLVAAQGAWASLPYVGYALAGIGAIAGTAVGLKSIGNRVSNWWSNRTIKQLRNERAQLLRNMRTTTRQCYLFERELDDEITKNFEKSQHHASRFLPGYEPRASYHAQHAAPSMMHHYAPLSYRETYEHYVPFVDDRQAPPAYEPDSQTVDYIQVYKV